MWLGTLRCATHVTSGGRLLEPLFWRPPPEWRGSYCLSHPPFSPSMRDLMPEELRRRLFARPQLFHGVCVPEFTVFRDPMNFDRIVNVIEWVGVEHYEIGEFADLDGAQVRRKSELLGGQQRRGTQRLHRSHRKVTLRRPVTRHSPQFPMRPKPL